MALVRRQNAEIHAHTVLFGRGTYQSVDLEATAWDGGRERTAGAVFTGSSGAHASTPESCRQRGEKVLR